MVKVWVKAPYRGCAGAGRRSAVWAAGCRARTSGGRVRPAACGRCSRRRGWTGWPGRGLRRAARQAVVVVRGQPGRREPRVEQAAFALVVGEEPDQFLGRRAALRCRGHGQVLASQDRSAGQRGHPQLLVGQGLVQGAVGVRPVAQEGGSAVGEVAEGFGLVGAAGITQGVRGLGAVAQLLQPRFQVLHGAGVPAGVVGEAESVDGGGECLDAVDREALVRCELGGPPFS